jgi:transcriptional regulator with XRE-family HTH domain
MQTQVEHPNSDGRLSVAHAPRGHLLSMALLREVRTARLLSMRELAALAQVAPSTIYLIEKRRTVPRLSMVRRLAAALQVDPLTVDEFRQAIERAAHPPSAND